jgi:predicted SAM-dependent methyltransferase
MSYFSETDKARELIDPKYLQGKVIDIGCGEHPITPDAIGVDGRDLPQVKVHLKDQDEIYCLSSLYPELKDADVIYSSHTLEHCRDDFGALMDWTNLLKEGGYLILYLPDGNWYDHTQNEEHLHSYTSENFLFWFSRIFGGSGKNYKGEYFRPLYKFIEHKHDNRPDCYSFLLIAQKV